MAASEGTGSGSGEVTHIERIPTLADQKIYLKDLAAGFYKLSYDGDGYPQYIYYDKDGAEHFLLYDGAYLFVQDSPTNSTKSWRIPVVAAGSNQAFEYSGCISTNTVNYDFKQRNLLVETSQSASIPIEKVGF